MDGTVERSVTRIRRDVPDAVALFLCGSRLRGDAGPRAEADQAADWAFGLPAVERLRLCWTAGEAWRAGLDRTEVSHPAGVPELGHFLGDLAKVANARHAGDEVGLPPAAQDLARSCPALLAPVNPAPAVGSRRAALRAALSVQVAPPGYAEDLLACLGLAAGPSTEDVYAAAARLAGGGVRGAGGARRRVRRCAPRRPRRPARRRLPAVVRRPPPGRPGPR